ncbi:hypothetical protein [Neisseria montereyensis]|uniref:H-type lectin domain-containing protein n=1 Tax=Neisseria montereyensis TaxID=2973938 RepID=A0ABT2FDD5_9NEIS|nr:hypothetical protein [Neisseria montereyensis]MCS4534229.1 hypothetical protein [Neisseria montereyensis]
MTLKGQIEALCDRLAAEIKKLRKESSSGSSGMQAGRIVFDLDFILYNRVDEDWIGLVNGKVSNSSTYILRFPVPFDAPPVMSLTSQRDGYRFLVVREVTKEYAVIGCNYWGSDLTLHWMAVPDTSGAAG